MRLRRRWPVSLGEASQIRRAVETESRGEARQVTLKN
jgi:hypothetical protein